MRRLAEGVCGGLILVAVTVGRAAAQDADGGNPGSLLLGVTLNGHDLQEPAVVLRRGGLLLVEENDARAWRLLVPERAKSVIGGRRYVSLSALPGVTTTLDNAQQVLRIQAPPEAFETQLLVGAAPSRTIDRTPAVNAAFVSYNLALEHGQASEPVSAQAFIQAGASGDWGLVTTTQTLGGGGVAPAVRLDTTYVRDDPARLRRLSLGDAITAGSAWVQPVRFAGLRYGTSFDLRPDLVTFPVPAFVGRTTVPSTVELYVNDVLRYRGQAEAGPFTVAQAPLVTGAGQVSLQVKDALGVEHAVSSSYYVSPTLLRPGLQAFSLEAGAERRGYGLASFDYGAPFAAATLRRGLTDWLTLEGRAEASPKVQDAGAGADLLFPALGEVTLSVGASTGRAGTGAVVQAGFSRVTPRWSLSASFRHATPDFRQVGTEGGGLDDATVRDQAQVAGGVAFGPYGAVTAAYTQQKLSTQPRSRIASITYTVRAWGRAFLNLFVLHSRVQGSRPDSQVGLSVTIPFGRHGSVYAQTAGRDRSVEVQSVPPTDEGVGGRALVRSGATDVQEADLTYRGPAGEATVQAAHTEAGSDVRLLVGGAVILAGGRVQPARQLNGGFALVETPGVPYAPIFVENRPVGRTDRNGRAVVTDLRPYEANRISIDASALPIEASLASDTLTVAPAPLGGARARFNIVLEHPAILVLHDPSGALLDPGLPARIDGGEPLRTGYDGELFTPTLREGAVIEVQRPGAPCRAVAPALPPEGGVPRITGMVCRPIEPRP